jgi:hypothetical protein
LFGLLQRLNVMYSVKFGYEQPFFFFLMTLLDEIIKLGGDKTDLDLVNVDSDAESVDMNIDQTQLLKDLQAFMKKEGIALEMPIAEDDIEDEEDSIANSMSRKDETISEKKAKKLSKQDAAQLATKDAKQVSTKDDKKVLMKDAKQVITNDAKQLSTLENEPPKKSGKKQKDSSELMSKENHSKVAASDGAVDDTAIDNIINQIDAKLPKFDTKDVFESHAAF